ncbi:ribonuclease H1 [Orussus abietinus]|uniref:ribonuclease H1 n=1 Tax=Orussus abietinus TaxID=222816 RepID=UPI0006264B91|nr:ribonuclease H1 [Orussus abietinus]
MAGRRGQSSFNRGRDGYVDVWTDGACPSNGRDNPRAGAGAWFGDNHDLNISAPVYGRQTNNNAEIQAATYAARRAADAGIEKLRINTDSKFLIDCHDKWMPKWEQNGWKTSDNRSVINKNELVEMKKAFEPLDVQLKYVPGHKGVHGNEMADQLARSAAERQDY